MKKLLQKFILPLFLIICLAGSEYSQAQIANTGQLLRAGMDDAEILVTEYIRPYAEGFGAMNNTGWVQMAGTHGVLGFNVGLRVGATAIPDSRGSFDLNDFDFRFLRPADPNDTVSPTISGENNSGPEVQLFQQFEGFGEVPLYSFNLPSGTGVGYAFAPMIQLSVGLPQSTEVSLRFVPEMTFGDYGTISVFGLGIKHEINRWIPIYLPIDISVLGGFSQTGLTGNYTLAPGSGDYDEDPDDLDRESTWEGQRAVLGSTTWHVNALAGRSLGPIRVYAGLGLQGSRMQIDFEGTHPSINIQLNDDGMPVRVLSSITDPLQVDVDPGTTFRTMVGGTISLGFIRFTAEMTYADYPVLNAGIGIGIR